jgi:hypothetical protein
VGAGTPPGVVPATPSGSGNALRLLLIGLAIGVIVYVASSGHVIFLPLIFLVPLGWLFRGRRRYPLLRRDRRPGWPW